MSSTEFSSESSRQAIKQAFALARASFDLSFEQLGVWLDESASTIKAWCDPKRQHCPPLWALVRLRQCHAGMAAYLDTWMESEARNHAPGPVAHSLEAQMNVCLGSTATVLESHCRAMAGDGRYDLAEGERNLFVLISHRTNVDRAIAKTREFIGAAETQPQMPAVNGGGK